MCCLATPVLVRLDVDTPVDTAPIRTGRDGLSDSATLREISSWVIERVNRCTKRLRIDGV